VPSAVTRVIPLYVRLDPLPDLKGTSVEQWALKALCATTHLVPDALTRLASVQERGRVGRPHRQSPQVK